MRADGVIQVKKEAAAQSQSQTPKIHVPFGGPAVIKEGHEKRAAMGEGAAASV